MDSTNMQWLFIVQPSRADMLTAGPTQAEMEAVGRHFAYWKDLTERGRALVVGRTQTTGPDTMGIAIYLAAEEGEARQIDEGDPAVVDGVFSMRFCPFSVALLGDPKPFTP